MGLAAAGALVYYVVLLSVVSAALIAVVLYPAAVFVGRVPLGRFARACAPSQVVALTSRSSLAALPATFDGARQLGLPEPIIAFFIPLSAGRRGDPGAGGAPGSVGRSGRCRGDVAGGIRLPLRPVGVLGAYRAPWRRARATYPPPGARRSTSRLARVTARDSLR